MASIRAPTIPNTASTPISSSRSPRISACSPRASWNDGQNEILSFTDIDRSISGGLSIKGSYWGRPADTIGIGGAINGLSSAHRNFLAAGGLGLLIGDGRLNYSNERILEAYYAFAINKSFTLHRRLSADRQSRLQCRSRPGFDFLRTPARRVLVYASCRAP